MHKRLKWACIICLIPLVLLLAVSTLVYIPAVQNAAVKSGAGYLSEKFGMKVSVEKIRLAFPLRLSAQNVCAVSAGGDTLLLFDKLAVDVRLRPLLNGNISVKNLNLKNLKLNSSELIDNMLIKGTVGEINLKADRIIPEKEQVSINQFMLENADIELFHCDTTAKDTTETPANWLITLGEIDFTNVNFSCAMPCDSLFINAEIREAGLSGGIVDLGKGAYRASAFKTEIARLSYAADTARAKSGFDASHVELSDIKLSLDSATYTGIKDITVSLNELSAKERSGLYIKNMAGKIVSDSLNLNIPQLTLETEKSDFRMEAHIPWQVIDSMDINGEEAMAVKLKAAIDGQDVRLFTGEMLKKSGKMYPDRKLMVDIDATGNFEALNINKCKVDLPEHIKIDVAGNVRFPLKDSLRQGKFNLDIDAKNIDFALYMASPDIRKRFHIPEKVFLGGNVKINRGLYAADLQFGEESGKVKLSGTYDIFNKSYDLSLAIDSLHPVHFMPEDSLMFLNGSLYAAGKGLDIFHKRTWTEIKANIADLHYINSRLNGLSFAGTLRENVLKAEFTSNYPFAAGNIAFDGVVMKNDVKGNLTVNVDTLDLKKMNVSDSTFSTSFRIVAGFQTNLKRRHAFNVILDDWNLAYEDKKIYTDSVSLAFHSEEDTVKVDFNTGDLNLSLTGNADPAKMIDKFVKLSKEAMNQLAKDSLIDMEALRPDFPDMTVHFSAEKNNPFGKILQEYNIFYETVSIDATLSPEDGLDIDGILLSFVQDTFKIDTVRLNIWQDMYGMRYNAGVLKNRFRNQNPFRASASGYLYSREADLFVSFINRNGEKGLDMGINMKKAPQGFDFHLYPEKVVLAFIPFTLNKNNFFHFANIKDMAADIHLKGNDNALLWIHSDTVGGTDAPMQEMMIEASQIDIEKTTAGLDDFQSFKGTLNAALRYEPTEESFLIMAEGYVDSLYYENGRIGDMLLSATYIPMEKNYHQVDIHAFNDMNEIAELSLLYKQQNNEGLLDGIASINKLPLKMIEPFASGSMIELNGFIQGDFSIDGTTEKPVVSGSLKTDSVSIFAIPSSTNLMLENRKIKISNNIINIDSFKVFAKKNFFVINGNVNAENLSQPTVNLKVSGSNIPFIDAKNTPGCMAYGKLFANLNTTVTGALQSLRARGNLSIPGTTNITYVMPQETLGSQDGFSNMVKFTYFADTLPRQNRRPGASGRLRGNAAVTGTDVFFTIHIDPVVRFNIDMDAERKNYVELKGGGDLTFQYTARGDMALNGRYSLSDGNIRYNIPVIPLTDFTVRNGSYIDWSGDPMNPYLNIAAYSRIRSSVKFDGENRMVDFHAGIRINNYLDKMALEFILEAPNDVNVQNQLASMGEEERSKQAISLLITGVYLASGGTGTDNLDMNAALSSIFQRKLRNMIGNLLGNIPFSFDVLTYDGLFGLGGRIDYIGRMHASFLNDRINSTVGLRYATDDPIYGNKLLLDDVSIEYMLDTKNSGSLSLFRNKQYKNIFEGETGRTGAGFTIRKKVRRAGDIFRVKSKDF